MEWLLMLLGLILAFCGYKLRSAKPKYLVERTTSGRKVKFLEYDESKRHKRNKALGMLMVSAGIMIFGIDFLFVFFAS